MPAGARTRSYPRGRRPRTLLPVAVAAGLLAGMLPVVSAGAAVAAPAAALSTADVTAPEELVVNGGFEDPKPEPGNDPQIVFFRADGSTEGDHEEDHDAFTLTGWTVTSGSVETTSKASWQPRGDRSLSLNGHTPGTITQQIPTVPGGTYTVSLWTGRQPSYPSPQVCPDDSTVVTVSFGGATQTFRAETQAAPGWTQRTFDVTVPADAQGTTTTLTLASDYRTGYRDDDARCGPLVDDVSVVDSSPPQLTGVSLTVTPSTQRPGAARVPIAAIPYDQIPGTALNTIASAPLRTVPLRTVSVASSPLRTVPLRTVPLRTVSLATSPLRTVTLNQLPLVTTTWQAVLAGTIYANTPLQIVTLDQVLVLADDPANAALHALSVADLDLTQSPLKNISASSLYLGSAQLQDIPVAGPTASSADNLAAWCDLALSTTGKTCQTLGITADDPVLALDLAGVDLRTAPLDSVPAKDFGTIATSPLRTVPLRTVPLRTVPLRTVPLRTVPLRTVDGVDVSRVAALAALTLGALEPNSPNLMALPYSAAAGSGAFPPCPSDTCTWATLGDAVRDGASGVAALTLGDLAATGALESASPALTIADLGELGATTIGDVLDALGPASTLTLAQVLLSLLDPYQIPWEDLPLDGLDLPRYDPDAPTSRVTASMALSGSGPARTLTATVTLPAGWIYTGNVQDLPAGATTAAVDGTVTITMPDVQPRRTPVTLSPSFEIRPSLGLRSGTASLSVTVDTPPGADPVAVPDVPAVATAVTGLSPNPADDPATAPVIAADELVIGHVTNGPQYYRLPVPPAGTRLTFYLSHVPVDEDLVVYGPPADPAQAAPLRTVPLRTVPYADPGVDATGAQAASTTLQNDVPQLTGLPLVGYSTQRGLATESVGTMSYGGTGQRYYTIQVTGYNGAQAPQPFVLRVRQDDQVSYTCPARFTGASGPTPGISTALPAGTRSLFLYNRTQLLAEFPGTVSATSSTLRVDAMLTQLRSLAARGDVAGALIDVGQDPAIAGLYAALNGQPCSIDATNALADALARVVRDARASTVAANGAASLRFVTLVGDDAQIPYRRIPDLTVDSNERGFGPELTVGGVENPLSAALKSGFQLSDDAYGTVEAVPWLDRQLDVPQLAVGRLVSTPEQIQAQAALFASAGGVLSTASSLTTGYDFLADGAAAVDSALSGAVKSGTRSTLISETWSRADALARLFPSQTSATPSFVSLNAHFDPSRALPAIGNQTGTTSDLITTADFGGTRANRYNARVLFSMGCHAGLDVPNLYSGSTDTAGADWPKTMSTQKAVWVANTGYGLGDTAAVALSEALMRDFAGRLDGSVYAGEALSYGKQAYFGTLGAYGVSDEKVLQQVVFYGLPMWRVGGSKYTGGSFTGPTGAPTVPTVTPAVPGTADGTGLPVLDTVTAPVFTRRDNPTTGKSFWDIAGDVQATDGQPIQPRTSFNVTPPAAGGVQPHGALITGLTTTDVAGVSPVFARSVVDKSGNEPAQSYPGVTFPTTFATLTSYATPTGVAQRAVLVPAQFFSEPGSVVGTQRLFTSTGTRTYYSASSQYTPPTFQTLGAGRGADGLTFSATVVPAAQDTVARVLVLAHGSTNGPWTTVELTRVAGTDEWTGTWGTAPSQVEYFFQAVDASGNVAISNNKGELFGAPGANETFAVTPTGDKSTPDNPFYVSAVTVNVTGPAVRYTASVDGGAPQRVFGSFSVDGDGQHTVTVTGSDGTTQTVSFRIDTTAPVVTVTPADGSAAFLLNGPGQATVTCDDGQTGSGVVSGCPGTVTVDTSKPGVQQLAVDVRDAAGNATTTAAYTVGYDWGGFLRPREEDEDNDAKAGSAFPISFVVRDANGPIGDTSVVASITSVRVSCRTGVVLAGVSDTTNDKVSYLTSYTVTPTGGTPQTVFKYVWKTDKAWSGTCRVLNVTLQDGVPHPLWFRFH